MVDRDPATLEGFAAAWQETTDALRESERRYRELVECSLGLICTHDLTGTILSINSASANSLGYQPGHGVGRNLRDSHPTSATSSTTTSGGFRSTARHRMMSLVAFDARRASDALQCPVARRDGVVCSGTRST
jgi:PAS domain-containing protein